MDLHFSPLTPYFCQLICHPEWHLHTLLKSLLGTVEIGSHHAHDSTLFIELGKVYKDVVVIQCGLLRNNNFDHLYVCFCHLQFGWLSKKLHISDTNHTLSSLSAHSATRFSHSHTSLGL